MSAVIQEWCNPEEQTELDKIGRSPYQLRVESSLRMTISMRSPPKDLLVLTTRVRRKKVPGRGKKYQSDKELPHVQHRGCFKIDFVYFPCFQTDRSKCQQAVLEYSGPILLSSFKFLFHFFNFCFKG